MRVAYQPFTPLSLQVNKTVFKAVTIRWRSFYLAFLHFCRFYVVPLALMLQSCQASFCLQDCFCPLQMEFERFRPVFAGLCHTLIADMSATHP